MASTNTTEQSLTDFIKAIRTKRESSYEQKDDKHQDTDKLFVNVIYYVLGAFSNTQLKVIVIDNIEYSYWHSATVFHTHMERVGFLQCELRTNFATKPESFDTLKLIFVYPDENDRHSTNVGEMLQVTCDWNKTLQAYLVQEKAKSQPKQQ